MEIKICSKTNMLLFFRDLIYEDADRLGGFFESLSEDTRSKFGPHPLNREHASFICAAIGSDNTTRFIILNASEVIGYFILDFNYFENEAERYRKSGIELDSRVDPVFAPCIADKYQNQGIAGEAMKILIDYAISKNLRSIVLMGGTQEPNILARSFYKKFGFKEYDIFYSDHNGKNNIDMMLALPIVS